ncbi:hypothetical protein ACG83_10240 [Frankia sp. R43]|uniref:hypothetical protein n=1 Tax=Frankia sp. R43 TaxID=269536 RepID=UPI0006DAC34F|nr:hypothetical protein [Frankia sp. R43]KPM55660.1 hypothetical protein ACG83_10240 [Frankia sp. R43]
MGDTVPGMPLIFAVDAETNGLYGPVWAIGAVVLDPEAGAVRSVFRGQISPGEVTDDWTRKHVVPVVDLPRYSSRAELLEAFWGFWEGHRGEERASAVADVGAPVEAGLFRACVERHPAARWDRGPYPLHELASALWMAGFDPDIDRRAFCGRADLTPHDPVDDATLAALCWARLARMRPVAA